MSEIKKDSGSSGRLRWTLPGYCRRPDRVWDGCAAQAGFGGHWDLRICLEFRIYTRSWGTSSVPETTHIICSGNYHNRHLITATFGDILPTPDILASLRLSPSDSLCLAGCEFSQNYNQLRFLEFLIPLLELLGISASSICLSNEESDIVPCLRRVPMGATFVVTLVERVNCTVVSGTPPIRLPPICQTNRPLSHSRSDRGTLIV